MTRPDAPKLMDPDAYAAKMRKEERHDIALAVLPVVYTAAPPNTDVRKIAMAAYELAEAMMVERDRLA